MQRLTEWFTGAAGVELTEADEPEKARKLRKMLGLFLQVRAATCALRSCLGQAGGVIYSATLPQPKPARDVCYVKDWLPLHIL